MSYLFTTPELRRARIAELEQELRELREYESLLLQVDVGAVNAECMRLIKENPRIQVIKYYRDKTGCSLTEAKCALDKLLPINLRSPRY